MAKTVVNVSGEKDNILTCSKCGRFGEVCIGPYGKELCSHCLTEANTPSPLEKKPFVKKEEGAK